MYSLSMMIICWVAGQIQYSARTAAERLCGATATALHCCEVRAHCQHIHRSLTFHVNLFCIVVAMKSHFREQLNSLVQTSRTGANCKHKHTVQCNPVTAAHSSIRPRDRLAMTKCRTRGGAASRWAPPNNCRPTCWDHNAALAGHHTTSKPPVV